VASPEHNAEEVARLGRLLGGRVVVDRLSIDFAGTFEFALWCKLLRDRGCTGHQVAFALGRSEGYVNNLIRILERAALPVLLRWRAEQQPGSPLPHACATDWLMQVCVLPHELQAAELARRIARFASPADMMSQERRDRPTGSLAAGSPRRSTRANTP
jgi:hypothetical protein